jgi:hypothetical protein
MMNEKISAAYGDVALHKKQCIQWEYYVGRGRRTPPKEFGNENTSHPKEL